MESKSPLRGPSRFKHFISGKGFYVALAVCLLAIGGIAAATFGQTLFVSERPKEPSTPQPPQPLLRQRIYMCCLWEISCSRHIAVLPPHIL